MHYNRYRRGAFASRLFFIDYYYLFPRFLVIYPTCGLKGQKRLAQGKANNVSRHPGYSVSAYAWRPERAKALDGMRKSAL